MKAEKYRTEKKHAKRNSNMCDLPLALAPIIISMHNSNMCALPFFDGCQATAHRETDALLRDLLVASQALDISNPV